MKQTDIYKYLQEIAEKFNIIFMEKNFRHSGIPVKSGLCKINGVTHFLMDKHKKISEKNEILARCLLKYPVNEIYILPAVRAYLERIKLI